jgi:hypothetical protein
MTTKFRLPEPATDRIVRVTNVHFETDEKVMKTFFDGLEIVDQFRTNNTRTGTKSIVYILFASIADKMRASDLSGYELIDRDVNIQPAKSGNFTRKF